MWLIGMKLAVIDAALSPNQFPLDYISAAALCRYIAPLGAPVLPEV